MEWIMELLSQVVLTVLGIAMTYLASHLGSVLGKFWREKMKDENIRSVASTCIYAVEQMYGGKSGAEKLEKALENCPLTANGTKEGATAAAYTDALLALL